MKLQLCTRQEAESLQGRADWAVISITDPLSAFGPAKLRPGWHAIHTVTFDDIDKDTLDIVCFVRAHSNLNGFMVNCSQGISCSQGVAAWISEHFNIPQFALIYKDSEFALDPKFNQHVYKMLKKHDRTV